MNEQPLSPTPGPELTPQPTAPAPQALTPDNTQPTLVGPQKKSSKKKLLIISLAVLIIAGAAAGAFYLTKNKTPSPTVASKSALAHLSLPNQPKQLNDQFGTQYLATGYVKYDAAKLKTISYTLPKLESIIPPVSGTTDKEVVFMTDLTYGATNDYKRLLMYDVASQTTYEVATDNSVGTYVNPKIMSDHYVVYAADNQTDPLTSNTSIRVTDLNTGDTKTILSDKASNLPASFCCAVSPDGLRLVIPQTNKFLIYQAGEASPTSFVSNVQVFPKQVGNDNSDYAASQRNYGYPGIVWLDDNSFMYAKSPPKQYKVDSTGTHTQANNNGLAVYNLTTGTSTDVPGTDTIPVNWFAVDGTNVAFTGFKVSTDAIDNITGLSIYNQPNYKDTASKVVSLADQVDYQSYITYSSAAKDVYVQPHTLDQYGTLIGAPSQALQTINISTGSVSTTNIVGFAGGSTIQGMIGPHQLVLDTSSLTDTIYNIYDISSKTGVQIFDAPTNK